MKNLEQKWKVKTADWREKSVIYQRVWMAAHFFKLDTRFSKLDTRFSKLDTRFSRFAIRFSIHGIRFLKLYTLCF